MPTVMRLRNTLTEELSEFVLFKLLVLTRFLL